MGNILALAGDNSKYKKPGASPAGFRTGFATDLNEAIEIARANPMFEDTEGRIEVRPVKTMEGIN